MTIGATVLEQAYEGGLRAVETSAFPLAAVLRAKMGAPKLAETCMTQLSKLIGGSAFSESSPFVTSWM